MNLDGVRRCWSNLDCICGIAESEWTFVLVTFMLRMNQYFNDMKGSLAGFSLTLIPIRIFDHGKALLNNIFTNAKLTFSTVRRFVGAARHASRCKLTQPEVSQS